MKSSKIAIRIGSNPNHHLWNNNGTWWLHYTEHLPDYTWDSPQITQPTPLAVAA